MGFLDILQRYAQGATPTTDTHAHCDTVAATATPEELQAVQPALLSSIAGGALSRFGRSGQAPTPQDADAVKPAQAGGLANAAQQSDPGIIDRAGAFHAQHPTLVTALGTASLALVMNHMANRPHA